MQYKTVQYTSVQCEIQKKSQNATESSALYHSITITITMQYNGNTNCPKMQQSFDLVSAPVAVLLLTKMALMRSRVIVTLSDMT